MRGHRARPCRKRKTARAGKHEVASTVAQASVQLRCSFCGRNHSLQHCSEWQRKQETFAAERLSLSVSPARRRAPNKRRRAESESESESESRKLSFAERAWEAVWGTHAGLTTTAPRLAQPTLVADDQRILQQQPCPGSVVTEFNV